VTTTLDRYMAKHYEIDYYYLHGLLVKPFSQVWIELS